jgi:hypothetical protein
MSAAKRLFALHRVDATFANTTWGSCMLKYRMGLDYKPGARVGSTLLHDILSHFLDFLTPALHINYLLAHGEMIIIHCIISGFSATLVCSLFEDGTDPALLRGFNKMKTWYKDVRWIVERWSYRVLASITTSIGF